MIRYLFLAAAIFGLIATLTAKHFNWAWAGYHLSKVLIAASYLMHHSH
jgi:hypothetical protein